MRRRIEQRLIARGTDRIRQMRTYSGLGLSAFSGTTSPVMQPLLDSVRTLGLITLRQGHDGEESADDWTYRSDHAPFHLRGIPYIHFGNEEHADYHAPTDTFEHIYPGFFYRGARTIAEFVRLLDRGLDPVATARAK